MEFTDRYQALGIPYPDESKMCKGGCEGIGVYPQFFAFKKFKNRMYAYPSDTSMTLEEEKRWHRFKCDGWHFIECPDCGGTGRKKEGIKLPGGGK